MRYVYCSLLVKKRNCEFFQFCNLFCSQKHTQKHPFQIVVFCFICLVLCLFSMTAISWPIHNTKILLTNSHHSQSSRVDSDPVEQLPGR